MLMNNLRIIVSKNRFYIWLYSIALLMPFVVNSFEVNVFISCLFLLFLLLQKGLKLSKIALISLICLLSILIIAFISHFFMKM